MSLFIASLNSGSNGNCYYIGTANEAVLVDAGISGRETDRRMKKLGLSMETVKAIFISHEHSDHITGLASLAKKYALPIYITPATLQHCNLPLQEQDTRSFTAFQPVQVGSLSVTAFPKYHDAVDPHSFIITSAQTTIGVFTDIGQPCEHVQHYFSFCHAAFLESNYDDDMLTKGRYPQYLKNRIRGKQGHLSNRQAFDLFTSHRSPYMSHLLLSHLSKDNNSPDVAQQLFEQHANGTHISVASRYIESEIFEITASGGRMPFPTPAPKQLLPPPLNYQLSLF